jgi:hypothetical protein
MPYTNLDITYWVTGLYFMLIMVLVYLVSRPQGFCKITKSLLHIVPFCEGPNEKPKGFAKQKQKT